MQREHLVNAMRAFGKCQSNDNQSRLYSFLKPTYRIKIIYSQCHQQYFVNVCSWDADDNSRVVLEQQGNDSGSDYINGSYIEVRPLLKRDDLIVNKASTSLHFTSLHFKSH